MANKEKTAALVIEAPKFSMATIRIVGTAPYMQHKFSKKSEFTMAEKHKAGSQARGKKVREARDFEADYEAATYVSREGWHGIPASCIRNAAISACRTVGFKMTLAKLSLFVEADGYDVEKGTPLIRIYGERKMDVRPVRNSGGGSTDLRSRPIWIDWYANVRVRWDEDQFSLRDVANLLMRVGMQVGIGEGRADSHRSAGIGLGHFRIESAEEGAER